LLPNADCSLLLSAIQIVLLVLMLVLMLVLALVLLLLAAWLLAPELLAWTQLIQVQGTPA